MAKSLGTTVLRKHLYYKDMLKMSHHGLTVIELMIAIAIVGILAKIAIPMYADYKEKARVIMAIQDIAMMSTKISNYWNDARDYPDSLAEIGEASKLDPWGQPYQYLNLNKHGNGGARRDRNLNPLNSDFDLYSKGKDNGSHLPITQSISLDDVLRANDGKFIDLAKNY